MITPISDRFNGFTEILHLSKSESKGLNRVIEQIASAQLQQKKESLQTVTLSQNAVDFLNIHKKIESIKIIEKNPAKIKRLDKINNIARKFEQIILTSLNTGNVRDLQQVQKLRSEINKIKNNSNLAKAINPDLQEEIMDLEAKMRSVEDNYQEIVSINQRMAIHEASADSAIESLAAKQTALESGGTQFSGDEDLSILMLFDQLIGFYKKYEKKESLPLYHNELMAKLRDEAYTLRFSHEDFCAEYQSAVEAEVLKTLQGLHQHEAPPMAEEKYQRLLNTLIEEKNKIKTVKVTLDSHINSLDKPRKDSEGLFQIFKNEESKEALFKEFTVLQNQMEKELKFFQDQITILTSRQAVGIRGRWTISIRDKQIEHKVRVLNEIEENVPNGWGKNLLLFSVWGLSKIGKFTEFSKFVNQSYQAISSGESPLKQTADLMSLNAFAKEFVGLDVGKQQTIEYDVSAIQGVLSGYVPFTEHFAKEHPAAADYLEGLKSGTADNSENRMSNSYYNLLHTPIEIMSKNETNLHALRYLGEQVRGEFVAEGKQLAMEIPWESYQNVYMPDVRPTSAFSLLAEELSASIIEAKKGVPLGDNKNYQNLQEDTKATFGSEFPENWFAGWIVNQDWDETRLGNFRIWFADNLECQARHHLINKSIHVKNDPTAIVLSLPVNPIDSGLLGSPDENDTSNQRRFRVIEHLADDIRPDQLFQKPLSYNTAESYSPLKAAMDVYTFVAGKAQLF